MYRAPHKCAICGEKLTVTRLSCEHCGTTMEGRFDGCRFCTLSPEEAQFLLTFIKNRGSIKDVERDMGVSYPTVRAALDNLIASLGLTELASANASTNADTEEPPKEGPRPGDRRTADSGTSQARKDVLRLLSEHKITADEAARRLKGL